MKTVHSPSSLSADADPAAAAAPAAVGPYKTRMGTSTPMCRETVRVFLPVMEKHYGQAGQ